MSAAELACLHGAAEDEVAILACDEECSPIPWQLDERDPDGELVLDRGPAASADIDHGAVDANDELVFMWSDALEAKGGRGLPGQPLCFQRLAIDLGGGRRWVYATRHRVGQAPHSPLRYVAYDPAADRMSGRLVDLTFAGPTPRGLSLRRGRGAGRDLLDRLKVRVSARFFGLFPLSRDEDDILSIYQAWRVGPIRVVRRERKWVRLVFGFRTPYLNTETTFYRDYSLLPVRLRLNYPPAKLLSHIELRAALDFINLRGWRVLAPGMRTPIVVGEKSLVGAIAPSPSSGANVVVLEGGDATLALVLRLGESLQSVAVKLYYRESTARDAPEDQGGQMPGVGFVLDQWGEVGRGNHWFVAESYALPAGYDPRAFAAEVGVTPEITVGPVEHGE